ncbi:hypothetical protein BZA77DRAFT_50694 [Pyronema omphalodes]|nr:hypothetical protein BZA77DRAFT_50694 [Pyronema omphalodes]
MCLLMALLHVGSCSAEDEAFGSCVRARFRIVPPRPLPLTDLCLAAGLAWQPFRHPSTTLSLAYTVLMDWSPSSPLLVLYHGHQLLPVTASQYHHSQLLVRPYTHTHPPLLLLLLLLLLLPCPALPFPAMPTPAKNNGSNEEMLLLLLLQITRPLRQIVRSRTVGSSLGKVKLLQRHHHPFLVRPDMKERKEGQTEHSSRPSSVDQEKNTSLHYTSLHFTSLQQGRLRTYETNFTHKRAREHSSPQNYKAILVKLYLPTSLPSVHLPTCNHPSRFRKYLNPPRESLNPDSTIITHTLR